MSLHDDEPLTSYEQGALGRALATPEADKWWAGLPPNTRRAIMQKLLGALANARTPRAIASLSRSLMKADELDLKRAQISAINSVQGNTNSPAEMFREVIAEIRNAHPAEGAEQASAEPAGDD